MAELKINVTETGIAKVKNSIKSLDTSISKVDSNISKTSKTMSSFNSIALKAGAAIGGLIAINTLTSAFISFNKSVISTTATFEKFNSILTTVEGSSAKAKESLDWISTFASTTPFQLEQVAQSFTSLRAYGIDPTNGSLKTLGDTASAMGKDVQQAVEALADAVVGENERLKEFGIRASVQGEQIKYTWTNASGEAREKIIANNSAIIESTLLSIFNSKYQGAMEDMSKTWLGMVSNLQDNWSIGVKNIGQSGLFDYFKAIITVVNEELTNALINNASGAKAYSNFMIDSINSIIRGVGTLVDAWNGVKLVIKGVELVAVAVVRGIEIAINAVVSGINSVIDAYNSVASLIGMPTASNIDFMSTTYERRMLEVTQEFYELQAEVMEGTGSKLAENFISDIDAAFADIQKKSVNIVDKTDFGDTQTEELKQLETNTETVEDASSVVNDLLSNIIDTVVGNDSEIEQFGESFSDYIKEVADSEDTYTVVTEAVQDATDSSYELSDAISDVSEAVEKLTFQFSDTLINYLENTTDYISNIVSTTSSSLSNITGGISYQEALLQALNAQQASAETPENLALATAFSDAIDTLSDSASSYLDTSNFASTKDYQLAQLTVANQMEAFGDVAVSQEDLLLNISELIAATNTALADGILTDEEKTALEASATNLQTSNESLLGASGAIASILNPTDGNGLKVDNEVADTSTLMKDATFSDNGLTSTQLTTAGLYTGDDINATVNTITGFAKDSSLVGTGTGTTNSVTSLLSDLMGSGTEGISINGLIGMTDGLSVATGLDVSDLSNISTNTSNTKKAIKEESIKGTSATSLDNLQIKNISERYVYYTDNYQQRDSILGNYEPSLAGQIMTKSVNYSYYAKGGYTGHGGKYEEAGIVHKGEYVVNQEDLRAVGGVGAVEAFLNGQGTTTVSSGVSMPSNSKLEYEVSELKGYIRTLVSQNMDLIRMFRNVTDGGTLMQVELAQ